MAIAVKSIRQLRAVMELSQEKLASRLGVSWKTIQRAEVTGVVSPELLGKAIRFAAGHGIEIHAACPCCGQQLPVSKPLAEPESGETNETKNNVIS